MGRNFIYTDVVRTNVVISSQNSTSVTSTGFDVSDCDSIVGILSLTSSVAVSSAGSATTDMSFYAAEGTSQGVTPDSLTGTRVVPTTDSDNQLICEVQGGGDRYIFFVIDGTTAVYSALHVIKHGCHSLPASQPSGTVAELHVSPTSGTA